MPDSLVAVMRQGCWTRIVSELGICFSVYAPKFRDIKFIQGRKIVIDKFLLGRYFFVEIGTDLLSLYSRLVNHVCVRGVLNVQGVPQVAREREVERLRSFEVKGYVPNPSALVYRRGQNIRITQGPLSGHEGKYERRDRKSDVISLNLMGQSVSVEVPLGGIEGCTASSLAGNISPI